MLDHPLNRREISELAQRLRDLIEMIEADELSAATGMTYRIQGAMTALEAALGSDLTLLERLAE